MRRIFCVMMVLAAIPVSAEERLQRFVGEFEGTLEQRNPHEKDAQWVATPVTLSGRWSVSGHYAELRGTFEFGGIDKPIEMLLLWGWDRFQKEYRLVVLDDFVGLVDVFEQQSASPLTLSNVAHGTYFEDRDGRTFNRVIVEFPEDGAMYMQWAGSRDGKTWREFARVRLARVRR